MVTAMILTLLGSLPALAQASRTFSLYVPEIFTYKAESRCPLIINTFDHDIVIECKVAFIAYMLEGRENIIAALIDDVYLLELYFFAVKDINALVGDFL